MHEIAAFLRDIRRRPHDDGPRLIFADWLEERGDPRGEFIRLQCLRYGFGVSDDRKAALWRQEQELLRRHEEAWVGPLRRRGIDWQFRRGLLHLRTHGHDFVRLDWADLAASEAWEWVETVAIRYTRQADVWDVAESPSLVFMESLDLSGNGLGEDDGAGVLTHSPHLARVQSLDLRFNRIASLGVARMAPSPALQRLVALTLDDNHFADRGVAALAAAPQPVRLETLSLRWNTIGPAGARALAESPAFPHLTTLHLGNNSIGDEGASALAKATGLRRLTELRLEYNGVGAAAAAALRRRYGDGVHL